MAVLIKIPNLLATGGIPILPAPPPTPWTPSELGGKLRGWWNPNSLALSTGTAVASLPSTGGITNTLAQVSGGDQPTYQLLNGKGALSFDGSGDNMGMSDLSISNAASALSMWMVYKFASVPADSQNKTLMGVRTNLGSNNRMAILLSSTGGSNKTLGLSYRYNDASGGVNNFSSTVADLNAHIVVGQIVFNGGGGPKLDLWQDGTNLLSEVPTFTPANLSTGDSNNAYIGCNPTAAAFSINGLIGQAGITRGSMTDAERQKLEGYLAWDSSLQNNLPSNHPYKYAAPV